MEIFGMPEKFTELLSITHGLFVFFLAFLLELHKKAISWS